MHLLTEYYQNQLRHIIYPQMSKHKGGRIRWYSKRETVLRVICGLCFQSNNTIISLGKFSIFTYIFDDLKNMTKNMCLGLQWWLSILPLLVCMGFSTTERGASFSLPRKMRLVLFALTTVTQRNDFLVLNPNFKKVNNFHFLFGY